MPQIKDLTSGAAFATTADYITQESAGDTVKLKGSQIVTGIATALADDSSFILDIGNQIAALPSVQGTLSTAFLADSIFLNYISAYVANNTDVHDIIADALAANADFNDAIRDNILNDAVFIAGLKTLLLSDAAFIGGIAAVLLEDESFIAELTQTVLDELGGASLQKRDSVIYLTASDANARNWFAAATNGTDVYASVDGGDIYKQTNSTGNFTAQSFTSRAYYGLTCLGTNLYASVGSGSIYMQTGGSGALNDLSQTARAWRGMSNDGTNVYACVYNDASGGDGGLYKQTAGTGDFVLYHSHEALIMDVLCAGGDLYYCVANGDIYKQTGSTGSFVAQGITKNWTSLSYINGDVYAFAQNDGIYRQNDKTGTFTQVYSTSTEEIRGSIAVGQNIYYALYGVGINRFPAPPKALEVFSTAETLTNETYLGYPVYRKVINFGALPNATTKSVAHGISSPYEIIKIIGYATNGTRYINIDFYASGPFSAYSYVDGANIVVGAAGNMSTYLGKITLEYIKADL